MQQNSTHIIQFLANWALDNRAPRPNCPGLDCPGAQLSIFKGRKLVSGQLGPWTVGPRTIGPQKHTKITDKNIMKNAKKGIPNCLADL